MSEVSFLLHGHLPFVYHPDKEDFLEEDWFNETLAEVYLPLLIALKDLETQGIKKCFTISLSPTLMAMMNSKLLQEKFITYINKRILFLEKEVDTYVKHQEHSSYLKAAYKLLEKYREVKRFFFDKISTDILNAFRKMYENGTIELITTGLTHTFSPNFQPYPKYIKFQVKTALDNFESFMGFRPEGFWLPECGYFEGLEEVLKECGLSYTILEAHGILMGDALPVRGVYAPVSASNGFTFFPRDIDSAKNVWSRETGYPASKEYRDFHQDIAYHWDEKHIEHMLHKNIILTQHQMERDIPRIKGLLEATKYLHIGR